MRCKWWSWSSYGSWHRKTSVQDRVNEKWSEPRRQWVKMGSPFPHWVGTKHNDKTLKDEIGHFRFSSNPLVMGLTERMRVLFPIPCKISVGHWARLSAGERMQWHGRVGENIVENADITQDTDTVTWGDMKTWAKHNDIVNNNLRARQETGKGWIASLNSSSRLTKRFLSTLF